MLHCFVRVSRSHLLTQLQPTCYAFKPFWILAVIFKFEMEVPVCVGVIIVRVAGVCVWRWQLDAARNTLNYYFWLLAFFWKIFGSIYPAMIPQPAKSINAAPRKSPRLDSFQRRVGKLIT